MGEVTVFPFSLAGGSEIVVLVRRDENLYRDLGGSVQSHFSPIHAAAFYLLKHTQTLLAPTQTQKLVQGDELLPQDDQHLFREVLAKIVTLPSQLRIRNIQNHFGYMIPVPHIDPELLNTNLTEGSLHWIRISTLFSVEEYHQFFTSYDMAILGQLNTSVLKQAIGRPLDQPNKQKIAIISCEDEALWQYHSAAMLVGNCLGNIQREKEISWLHYEGELPAEEELEDIYAIVVIGWREKWTDGLKILLNSKLLVLGSAANMVTMLLGGMVEAVESTVPAISDVVLCPSLDTYKPYATNTGKVRERQQVTQLITCHSHTITQVPETAKTLAETSDQVPIAYALDEQILVVQGHPEYTCEFTEEKLIPDLLQLELCSEDDLENVNWKQSVDFTFFRELCEFFLLL